MIVKLIQSCIEKKDAVLGLLFQENIKSDDVFELVQTTQTVESILKKIEKTQYYNLIDQTALSFKVRTIPNQLIGDLLKSPVNSFLKTFRNQNYRLRNLFRSFLNLFQIFQRSLEKVEAALVEYYNALLQAHTIGLLHKQLTNTNFRKKIDQLNSLWLVEATTLDEKHEYPMMIPCNPYISYIFGQRSTANPKWCDFQWSHFLLFYVCG